MVFQLFGFTVLTESKEIGFWICRIQYWKKENDYEGKYRSLLSIWYDEYSSLQLSVLWFNIVE